MDDLNKPATPEEDIKQSEPIDSHDDTQDNHTKTDTSVDENITPEQVEDLKLEAINFATSYAKSGISSRKEPSSSLANDQGPYYWWNKQATFESNTWSISLWEYDNKAWQLQATKVELQPDGKSHMTAYSMRKDNDTSFPGFQIYREQKDDRYHHAEVEDIVYLNRVLKDLIGTIK